MGTYAKELSKAMELLSKDQRTILIGQNVKYGGTSMFWTFENTWPEDRRIETPVVEDIQMGMSIGMALEGMIPITVYPRMDFLVLALNQLVNHLDKMDQMSDGQFKPKVIIRTAIGSNEPLMPGPQHMQDHTEASKKMVRYIKVVKLTKADQIVPAYKEALESDGSTMLVEIPDLYNKDLEERLIKARKEWKE